MSVYKPNRRGAKTKFYVCEFVYQGKRIQESTGCSTKTAALNWEQERKKELERAHAGLPSERKLNRILSVSEIVTPYLEGYRLTHRASSTLFAETKLRCVTRVLGSILLSDLTEGKVRQYISFRQVEGVSGRTINMELGELSRAIGHPWSLLWPKIRKLEERKDLGQALTPNEQRRILDASSALRSSVICVLIPLLLLTGMRPGEAMSLKWSQVDLFEKMITAGRAKTSSGTGRVIPINEDLAHILAIHLTWFLSTFGEPSHECYVFPFGSPQPTQPKRPVTDVSSGWDTVRKVAGVRCRLHDLRHTFCTRLAEAGVAESTMLSLMGHMSRAMLERYSHIRIAAKRQAVAGITLHQARSLVELLPVKVPVAESSGGIQ